ncbi:MAG TPA: pitrilysin family protein [Kofleriaceae bacterium]|nr:pitrilysin family protein [Kofleriaceae bacterium]
MPWTTEITHPFASALHVRRHRLHNGLGLVVLADAGAPIVSYQTWYAVGSRHESPGQTGMAHLFEHLMFGQTRTRPAGEFDRTIERTGGDSNAATWVDWTYYRDSVPARDLALVIALESDRMVNLALEPAVLEAEREVVANERMQRVDDEVEGFADEELSRLAYTIHPYGWPTIGWMEDIRSMGMADVQRFYETYYAPNNATLVVVGDVDEVRLLELVERHYGDIAPAELPAEKRVVEPAQESERRRRFAKPTPAPRLLRGYRAVDQAHADWPALSFVASLLSSGPSSRLHRRLVIEREISLGADCDVGPQRDPGLFRIATQLTREHQAEEAEAEIDAVLADLAERRVDDAELEKVRSVVETDYWGELEGVDGRAEALGHYQTTLGDFRKLFEVAERLSQVTAEDVQHAVRTYLIAERRCSILIDPEGDDGGGVRDDDPSDDGDDGHAAARDDQ